ncbi:hypothetical protein [Microbulbifer sp. ALW1]|uniref:hypothetical protein n=1 Tax=Microbulbifer sp. (strain ALW1) TaxID=1516059 RepID=UPI00135C6506|nr:hypothetical protein [Microbulbifer sp. ALW1]
MKQSPAPLIPLTQSHRKPLPPWLAVVLLGLFLSVRGLVPAGFMPAPVAGGSLYALCHGDSRSALLLNLLSPPVADAHLHHHGGPAAPAGHDHDTATAKNFAESHCTFSAAGSTAIANNTALPDFATRLWLARPPETRGERYTPDYFTPPGRAPPAIS